jgi:hypothetical protein
MVFVQRLTMCLHRVNINVTLGTTLIIIVNYYWQNLS